MPHLAYASVNPFFTTRQVSFSDLSAFSKWTEVMPRYLEQKAERDANCTEASCVNRKWEALIDSQRGQPVAAQLRAVNSYFNAMPYVEDEDNWGVADYWATPYEFMDKGGDCEDYAIAKYITLKRLGVAESQMRIMIVQDNSLGGVMHAVLEVRQGGHRYLLDNQAKSVVDEAAVYHYRPIYAINAHSWWAYQ